MLQIGQFSKISSHIGYESVVSKLQHSNRCFYFAVCIRMVAIPHLRLPTCPHPPPLIHTIHVISGIEKQVLMFYHLKTRRCVNTVLV